MEIFEIIKILDTERFLNKRLIFEMLYSKLEKNNFNLQSDTEYSHIC